MRANCEPVSGSSHGKGAKGATTTLLPLSGGCPKQVTNRWRRFARTADAAAVLAMPADQGSIDLTWRSTTDLVLAFDAAEQAGRVLEKFRAMAQPFIDGAIDARQHYRRAPKERERLLILTRSAAHLYAAFAQSALDRFGFERVLRISFEELGELIVIAVDVLEHTSPGTVRHG